jgi:hypothetical protein
MINGALTPQGLSVDLVAEMAVFQSLLKAKSLIAQSRQGHWFLHQQLKQSLGRS